MALHSIPSSGGDTVDNQDDIGIDPRTLHDDPLLDSLMAICMLHGSPASRVSLTAGLPLVNNRLTLAIFSRAAARANLAGTHAQA